MELTGPPEDGPKKRNRDRLRLDDWLSEVFIMGDIAEDVLSGLMCQICGCWMPEIEKWIEAQDKGEIPIDNPFLEPPGYQRSCADCEEEKAYNDQCDEFNRTGT